jgi:hypothetical protein
MRKWSNKLKAMTLGVNLVYLAAFTADAPAMGRRYDPTASPGAYHAPAMPPSVVPPGAVSVVDNPASFLVALNAWRAQNGRGPVGWDTNLAAAASRNDAIHSPGSFAGRGQCWSSSPSYLESLRLWENSPPHAAILLGATTAVGCSPCPSGMTCNAL